MVSARSCIVSSRYNSPDVRKAEFRLVVFRPFKGEVITGRISSSSDTGIKVALDFFDDVHVPLELMFEGSHL